MCENCREFHDEMRRDGLMLVAVVESGVDCLSVETELLPLSQSVSVGRQAWSSAQPGGRWSILRSPHLAGLARPPRSLIRA